MVEDTASEVSSYVRNQESITVLTQAVNDSELTLTVDDASAISRGLAEIGDELIYVKSVNTTAGTITVIPGGRGWRGTTATSHGVNTVLRNNPTFPRAQIRRALNDTIRGIDLRAIDSHEFEFDGTQYAYALPTNFQDVTGVAWDAPDTTEIWPLIKRFRLDRNFRVSGDSSTMRTAIVLLESPMPGRTVRVQYAKFPTALSSDGDDFVSVTGLPASAEDVIRLGAMWRLVSTIDPGKVVAMTPSADLVDSPVPSGESTTVARYLYQLFTVRLAEERAKQQDNYMSIIQYAR
jgi:hypothetical protein